MVIRVCVLCDKGSRDDDASLDELVKGLSSPDFQKFLIKKEEQWVLSMRRYNASNVVGISIYTRVLKTQWTALMRETDALDRIKHYRNKVLAHATTGHDPNRKVLIKDIWQVSRLVLSVAKYVRLLLERDEWNYSEHAMDAKNTLEL